MSTKRSLFNDQIFLLYPQHESFLTEGHGNLKNPALWEVIFSIIFTAIMIAIYGWFIVTEINERNVLQQLEAEGTTTTATIISHRTSSGKSTTYYVTYQFGVEQPNNPPQTYTHEQSVSRNIYNLGDNAPIAIRYLPNNPNVSRVQGSKRNDWVYPIMGLVFLIFPVLLFHTLNQYLRKKRLEREGQVIMGELQACTSRYVKGGYRVDTKYTFLSPMGDEITGKTTSICNHLKKQRLPLQGERVAVIYVSDRLHRML